MNWQSRTHQGSYAKHGKPVASPIGKAACKDRRWSSGYKRREQAKAPLEWRRYGLKQHPMRKQADFPLVSHHESI